MNTLTVETGSPLSLTTQGQVGSPTAKQAVANAQQRPANGVTSATAAEVATTKAALATPAQKAELMEALERVLRLDQRLSFRVDESSGKSVVVVKDARTSEVLKQFPSEEMLNIARRMEEHLRQSGDAAGVLHSDEV
jgi:flagellar protein FlaG